MDPPALPVFPKRKGQPLFLVRRQRARWLQQRPLYDAVVSLNGLALATAADFRRCGVDGVDGPTEKVRWFVSQQSVAASISSRLERVPKLEELLTESQCLQRSEGDYLYHLSNCSVLPFDATKLKVLKGTV